MDRGLAVVLTILTGAALGLVEACSGVADDRHPPVANNYGELQVLGAAASAGNASGNGTAASGTTSNDRAGNAGNGGNGAP